MIHCNVDPFKMVSVLSYYMSVDTTSTVAAFLAAPPAPPFDQQLSTGRFSASTPSSSARRPPAASTAPPHSRPWANRWPWECLGRRGRARSEPCRPGLSRPWRPAGPHTLQPPIEFCGAASSVTNNRRKERLEAQAAQGKHRKSQAEARVHSRHDDALEAHHCRHDTRHAHAVVGPRAYVLHDLGCLCQ